MMPYAAGDCFDQAIDSATDEFVRARLALFRLHLQREVSRASPLLLDIVVEERFDLGAWIDQLVPPSLWPLFQAQGFREVDTWPSVVLLNQRRSGRQSAVWDGMFERCHSDGVVVRNLSHPNGALALRVLGDCLEITLAGPGFMIMSFGDYANIWLDRSLPETMSAASIGRPVDHIAEHWLTRGRDYEITALESVNSGQCTVVSFMTGTRPFRLPLPAAMEGSSGAYRPASGNHPSPRVASGERRR